MTVQKIQKQPKKSAAIGGRLLVLFWGLKYSHFLEVQNQIYTYWVYLMEHILLGVQLCIEILFFSFCFFCGICNLSGVGTTEGLWALKQFPHPIPVGTVHVALHMGLAEKVNPGFAYFDKPWLLAILILPLTLAGTGGVFYTLYDSGTTTCTVEGAYRTNGVYLRT